MSHRKGPTEAATKATVQKANLKYTTFKTEKIVSFLHFHTQVWKRSSAWKNNVKLYLTIVAFLAVFNSIFILYFIFAI